MSEVREGASRPAPWSIKPTWWWFMVHGVIVIGFSLFTLITPFTDERGFLLDGHGFALLLLLCGALVAVQAVLSRDYARGWGVLFAGGIHAIAASIALWIIASLGDPYVLFWSIVSFLAVEGGLFTFGLLGSPVFRLWGVLMGSCMMAAALIMTVAWVSDPAHSFDIPDAGMGIAGLLYGAALFVAALQARAVHYRDGRTREG